MKNNSINGLMDRKIKDEHVIHGTKVVPVYRRPGIAYIKSTEIRDTVVLKSSNFEGIEREWTA